MSSISLLNPATAVALLAQLLFIGACSGTIETKTTDEQSPGSGSDEFELGSGGTESGGSCNTLLLTLPSLSIRVHDAAEDDECLLSMDTLMGSNSAPMKCAADVTDCVCSLDPEHPSFSDLGKVQVSRDGTVLSTLGPWPDLSTDPCGSYSGGEHSYTLSELSEGTATDLSELRLQANEAANAIGCDSIDDCAAMPMGSKPCGGPTSFIVYSTKSTDLRALQEKADEVTEAEDKHNQETGAVSDCAINEPPSLVCKDNRCAADI